jgi:hypothetical protein
MGKDCLDILAVGKNENKFWVPDKRVLGSTLRHEGGKLFGRDDKVIYNLRFIVYNSSLYCL